MSATNRTPSPAIRTRKRLPEKINAAEAELGELDGEMAKPDFYNKAAAHVAKRTKLRARLATQVKGLYARWEELEGS